MKLFYLMAIGLAEYEKSENIGVLDPGEILVKILSEKDSEELRSVIIYPALPLVALYTSENGGDTITGCDSDGRFNMTDKPPSAGVSWHVVNKTDVSKRTSYVVMTEKTGSILPPLGNCLLVSNIPEFVKSVRVYRGDHNEPINFKMFYEQSSVFPKGSVNGVLKVYDAIENELLRKEMMEPPPEIQEKLNEEGRMVLEHLKNNRYVAIGRCRYMLLVLDEPVDSNADYTVVYETVQLIRGN